MDNFPIPGLDTEMPSFFHHPEQMHRLISTMTAAAALVGLGVFLVFQF